MIKVKRALISVSDKSGLTDFASFLHKQGVEIISTGGTLKAISDAGIPVKPVDQVTGFPEMMDGRLKTLHPKVHGGLLALRDNPEHAASMKEHDIHGIDLLVVNLYPFAATVASGKDFATCIENIDIGGPAMIRAGAKNHGYCAVVCDPSEYGAVETEITSLGAISEDTAKRLAGAAYAHTASYDALISDYFHKTLLKQDKSEERATHNRVAEFPPTITLSYRKQTDLRYGENPHQQAAFYRPALSLEQEKQQGIAGTEQLQGKELSFNNLLDTSSALMCSLSLPDFGVAIVKHLNPCGVASASSQDDINQAFLKARACDPISAFGGVISINGEVDKTLAETIAEQFAEVIVAPHFSPEALEVFSAKKNLRLLRVDRPERFLEAQKEIRQVHDGILLQDMDISYNDRDQWKVVSKREPDSREWQAMQFAWRLVKHVKSNAIVFTGPSESLAIGAGQMSRVDAAEIAMSKARKLEIDLHGSVAASDAFFPFRDGLDILARAGATAVIQPGGSVRDEEVIAAADEQGVAMVFTGMRHFRH
ncbi:MAG: bifunctional phosphoribosylaminoimidazolecarboxamide formyltransferase/inosine monophosphate cyclohydrolase [Spirochaetaceae bacterium]|nr:bifunctional phosphoribosylaminoimidazolecarboxamide formyltransferase/inosine monophosphate cyclohydrolase [Spirochaetaceae bacterium]|tara:strand:- start:57446 stop:59059 length:1614 start_codon:yes stop_codon:yes gene_type:complete